MTDSVELAVEAIITRRAIQNRLDGFTIETAREIAAALSALPVEGGAVQKQGFSASQGSPVGHGSLLMPPETWRLVATAWYDGFVDAKKRADWDDMYDWAALSGESYAREKLAASPPPDHDPQHGGWRDIASAPRDGTRFLAFGGGLDAVETAYWSGDVCCWCAESVTLDDLDDESEGYCRPTHWQPLPAPPAVTALSGGGDKDLDLSQSHPSADAQERSHDTQHDDGEG